MLHTRTDAHAYSPSHTHTWVQISNLVAYLRPNSRRLNQYPSPGGFHQFIAGPLQSADPSEGVWTALWGKQIALLQACISAMLWVPEAGGERGRLARINYVSPTHRKRKCPQCDTVFTRGKGIWKCYIFGTRIKINGGKLLWHNAWNHGEGD